MSINHYKSVKHTTHNENGREELELVHEKTLQQSLFRKPATTEVYEKFFSNWFNKKTGMRLDDHSVWRINRLKDELKYAGMIGQYD